MGFVVRKPASSNKTIRMPNAMIDEMEKIATQKEISFNQLVLQCCEYALKNLTDDGEQKTSGGV